MFAEQKAAPHPRTARGHSFGHRDGEQAVKRKSSPGLAWNRGSSPRGHPIPSRASLFTVENQPWQPPAGGTSTNGRALERASPDGPGAARLNSCRERSPALGGSPEPGAEGGLLIATLFPIAPLGTQLSSVSIGTQAFSFLSCTKSQNRKVDVFKTHRCFQHDFLALSVSSL